jgi:CHAT domain-containing protein
MAAEEGETLGSRYPHIRMGATADEMKTLLGAALTDEGRPAAVQIVHMACHGEVDPNNAAYNGIVLSGDTIRLDPLTIAGSEIGRRWSPLVFLNACQLASDTGDILADYGGMAGAFLGEGCRAFIAPLWSVNDTAARDTAIDFYRMTIDEGIGAGEALMRIRSRALDGGSITPLAYVFYGHPRLELSLGGEAVVLDLRADADANA